MISHYTVSVLGENMSPLNMLHKKHATSSNVIWNLFVDCCEMQQLPHLYQLAFIQELTTVIHCSDLLTIWYTGGKYAAWLILYIYMYVYVYLGIQQLQNWSWSSQPREKPDWVCIYIILAGSQHWGVWFCLA